MSQYLQKLLQIAEENAKKNPSVVSKETYTAAKKYLDGVIDEVEEVTEELKDNNAVHLQDELSDIVWDYFMALKVCEERGWIDSAEAVFEHAFEKYTERAPALIEADEQMWDSVKERQKDDLAKKHSDRYGV